MTTIKDHRRQVRRCGMTEVVLVAVMVAEVGENA